MKKIDGLIKKLFKKKIKGFALVTVLMITALLLVLLVALISLTSNTLYRSTADVERSSIVPVAEAGINEVLLKMKQNALWGTNGTEKLLMRFNDQKVSIAGINEANLPSDATSHTQLSYENKGFYYITFDPNDPAFTGTRYYSVNNLDRDTPPPTTLSWRGKTVPAGMASIVVTAVVGNTVKHIEALVSRSPSGSNLVSGSRGKINVNAKDFMLESLNGTPSFHSNSSDGIVINASNSVTVKDGGTISARGPVSVTAPSQSGIDSQTGVTKNVPSMDLDTLTSKIDFAPTPIPSGVYVVSGNKLYYNPDDEADPNTASTWTKSFDDTQEIVDGLKFFSDGSNKGKLIGTKNLIVDYNSTRPPGKTGNLIIYNATWTMGENESMVDDESVWLAGGNSLIIEPAMAQWGGSSGGGSSGGGSSGGSSSGGGSSSTSSTST
ncbi:MAG: hypothetical protein ABRQ39_28875, partial [Candidatus Eremiobacterota bacterium]